MPPAMKVQVMKVLALFILSMVLVTAVSVLAQSGRKSTKPLSTSPPPVVNEPAEKPAKPTSEVAGPQVMAGTGEEYKCTNDDSLSIVVHSANAEKVFAPNEVTTRAVIRFRPKPEYTREARRKAIEGNVAVRAVLSASGKVFSVTIVNKGLPYGLNDSAIHAACKIEFTPATKAGQSVSQWLKIEYPFRSESSIYRH